MWLQVIPPGMDFSTVVVADAGDVIEGDIDMVAFTGDATNVVPVSPRVKPPIWDEVCAILTPLPHVVPCHRIVLQRPQDF